MTDRLVDLTTRPAGGHHHDPHPFCAPQLCQRAGCNVSHQQTPRMLDSTALDEDEPPVAWHLEQHNEIDADGSEIRFPPVVVLAVGRESVRMPLSVACELGSGVTWTAVAESDGLEGRFSRWCAGHHGEDGDPAPT